MESVNAEANPALTREAYRRLRTVDRQLLDYAELDQVLADLLQRPKHEIVVPISEVAFIPGEIRDTNCILTLLGDQTFVEKTNQRARELIARRQKQLEQQRAELLPLLEEQIVDIREEYFEDEKQSAPCIPQNQAKPTVPKRDNAVPEQEESFEEFWNRLGCDQLEAEEQKQKESVSQLHGFFASKPKPPSEPSIQPPDSAVADEVTYEGNPAPRRVSRFKAQRQQMKS